jgi:hypothetical protein
MTVRTSAFQWTVSATFQDTVYIGYNSDANVVSDQSDPETGVTDGDADAGGNPLSITIHTTVKSNKFS